METYQWVQTRRGLPPGPQIGHHLFLHRAFSALPHSGPPLTVAAPTKERRRQLGSNIVQYSTYNGLLAQRFGSYCLRPLLKFQLYLECLALMTTGHSSVNWYCQ